MLSFIAGAEPAYQPLAGSSDNSANQYEVIVEVSAGDQQVLGSHGDCGRFQPPMIVGIHDQGISESNSTIARGRQQRGVAVECGDSAGGAAFWWWRNNLPPDHGDLFAIDDAKPAFKPAFFRRRC